MSVNTNVAALAVQRSLLNNAREMATSMQRLSTGARINGAADDAAGVSIAERMETQITGYGKAIRNAGDAISILETADGGLGAIADTLQRMRVLATAAANGTTVTADRESLTLEVDQLKAEINRIANVVKFNGISPLDGSFANAQFQVGTAASETITVSIQKSSADAIGEPNTINSNVPIVLTGPAVPVAQSVTLSVQGVNSVSYSLGTFEPSAPALAAAINATTSTTNLVATALANSVTTTQTNTTATLNALEPPITATLNGVGIDIPVTPLNPAWTSAQKDNALRDNFITAFNARKASGVAALQDLVATNTGTGIALQNLTPPTVVGQAASTPVVTTMNGQAQGIPAGVFTTGNTTFRINGVNIAVSTTNNTASNRSATVAAINAQTATTGVTAVNDGAAGVRLTSGSGSITTSFVSSVAKVDDVNLTSSQAAQALGLAAFGQTANPTAVFNAGTTQFTINGVNISVNTTSNVANNRTAAVAAINAQTALTGVTALNDGTTGVRLRSANHFTTAFVSATANVSGTVLTAAEAARAFGLSSFGTPSVTGGNLTLSYSGPAGTSAANFGLPASGVNFTSGTSNNSAASYAAVDPYVEFSVNGVNFEVNVTNFTSSMTTAQRNTALRNDFVNAFNAKKAQGPSALDGITASATSTGVDIRALDGRTLTVLYTAGPTGTSAENFGVLATPTYGKAGSVNISYVAPDGVFKDITFSASTGLSPPVLAPGGINGTSVQDVDLTDQFFANYAMQWIDSAIDQVANYRANVGSALNRFGMTIANLRTTVENLEASRSRIRDTDFAIEYSKVARRRVVQESGMAMLEKVNDRQRLLAQLIQPAKRR